MRALLADALVLSGARAAQLPAQTLSQPPAVFVLASWAALSAAAAAAGAGKVVGGTKRDGGGNGQGMARVRATNEEGKEELFQLFERRLHAAAWSDLQGADPVAFLLDPRKVGGGGGGSGGSGGKGSGGGGGSNGQRLRPVWSAVLLAPDDGSGKDGGGFETVTRVKRRAHEAQEVQESKDLRRRMKEVDSPMTVRHERSTAAEFLRTTGNARHPLLRFAALQESHFTTLAGLVYETPTTQEVRGVKEQLETVFGQDGAVVEGLKGGGKTHALMHTVSHCPRADDLSRCAAHSLTPMVLCCRA